MADATTEDNPTTDLSYDDFEPVSPDEWRQTAVESNNGKPFEKLTTRTYEGITLQPFYTAADTAGLSFTATMPGFLPYVRGATATGNLQTPWLVAEELAHSTPLRFNEALIDDLERGQTAVNMLLDRPTRAGLDPDQALPGDVGMGGLSLATASDMAVALAGVEVGRTPLMIRTGTISLPLLALLATHVRRQGKPTSELCGWLESDPLGTIAQEGTLPLSLPQSFDEVAHLTVWAAQQAPLLGTVAIHTYPYHDAGAGAVQELAFGLATAVHYLREMIERGVPINVIAPRMRLDLAVGPQFFMEIAKLRAARLLWAQMIDAFGGDETAQRLHLHVRTGHYNKTRTDPTINMLRVTTEALAAALGGADSLHVSPYDEPTGHPDDFSRRIARNVQIILQDEVHLTRLVDPAGGTWAVESLVNELAHQAWGLFQTIEAGGGIWAALQHGSIQQDLATLQTTRAANLATRKDVLVGTNQYVHPGEQASVPETTDLEAIYAERATQLGHYRSHDEAAAHVAALGRMSILRDTAAELLVEEAISAAHLGATLNEITRTLRAGDTERPSIAALPNHRASEPFEALRALSRAAAVANGRPPTVFLANIGPLRQHKARADFAQGFFEVGGFGLISPGGFATADEAAVAALASGAEVVTICSTDETYPDLVPRLAEAIKLASPKTAVLVAGRPGDREAAFRAAGVDDFIYVGADCLAVNRQLLDQITLEVKS